MNWKKRSNEKEIMDDLQLEGIELFQTLDEIDLINKWLGGFESLIEKLEEIVSQYTGQLTITDLGCGSGWLLKQLEKKNWKNVTLVGLDANAAVIDYAQTQYNGNVQFVKSDVFEYMKSLEQEEGDILISSLFCHHFNDAELIQMMEIIQDKKAVFIINDLQRNPLAFHLFKLVGVVFRFSNMAKIDGSISIKRAFTKTDWERILASFPSANYSIEWKWAFRYLVVLDLRNRN